MTDVATELLNMFKDRAKSRFWPTYILVWCAMNWDFLYVIFFVPNQMTKTTTALEKLYELHDNLASFFGVPFLVTLVITFVIPYLDVFIGWIQHLAIYWNKNQSTKLSLKVAREKTRLEKEILAEVVEQKEIIDKANKLLEDPKIESNRRKSADIFNTFNSIISHEKILLAIQSHDNDSQLNTIRTEDIDKYILTSRRIGIQYPDEKSQNSHTEFLQNLTNFKEINAHFIERLRLNPAPSRNGDVSPKYKNALNELHDYYLKYRQVLQDIYGL